MTMGKEAAKTLADQLPRWALVILACIGIFSIRDLHSQIRNDHDLLQQHAVEIRELRDIARRLTAIVEQAAKKNESNGRTSDKI